MKVRSRRKQARLERLYITAALFGVLLLAAMLIPRVISTATAFVLQPAHAITVWINESEQALPNYLRSRRALDEQIAALESELAAYAGLAASRAYITEENDRLRKLLNIDEPMRSAATIIARPNELPYDLLQIDQGSADSVQVGAPVFINKFVAIGIVEHVSINSSLVRLVSSPGFESTVFIGGPNVIANLEGQGGGVARVRVPQGIALEVGNTIALPAINAQVLGRIEVIESVPTQAEQYGYITLPIGLQHIHTVMVGTPAEITTDITEISKQLESSLATPLKFDGLATSTFSITTSDMVATSTATSS